MKPKTLNNPVHPGYVAILLCAVLCLLGGWQTATKVTLDPQTTLTVSTTAETEVVPAVTGRIPILTTLTIVTKTQQDITVMTGTTDRIPYPVPAYAPGIIDHSDGVVCYGAVGESIKVKGSIGGYTIYARYRYQ